MVKSATLAKIGLGLVFPIVGMAYFTQNKVAKSFAKQSYYVKSIELLKGYKPAMDRLGEPIVAKLIDVSDAFNYQDLEIARAKIPIEGKKTSANLLVYAVNKDMSWCIDKLEISYKNDLKYKFYDGDLGKKEL